MSPRPTELPESEFAAAIRIARNGRFAEAMAAVAERVRDREARESKSPEAANALAEIASLAEAAGDRGAAERAVEAALALRPRYPDLHYRRACLLLRGHRWTEARRALEAALTVNPRYLAARLELAMLDAREGLVGEALESLRALSGNAGEDERRAFQQGLRRLEHAEWEEADGLLRRALHLDDASLEGELRRARELVDQDHAREAAALVRSLLPRFGAYPDVHAVLGRAHIALGHFDDAMLALSRALELNPGYHDARVLLAYALEGAGELVQAQEQVALVLEHEPEHADALERVAEWARRGSQGVRTRRRVA
jgi:tetratricopeptide (TPR) repeat protein